MKKEQLLEKLDRLHDEIIEIVINRNNDYIDDIDMLDSDINNDFENDVYDNMNIKEFEEYVKYVENMLELYKGVK